MIRIVFCCLCLLLAVGHAQFAGKQTGCSKGELQANPNRPTVADPADITQYGVAEVEYGWDRTRVASDTLQTGLNGLLKFAVLCDLEIRWSSNSLLRISDGSSRETGAGDNWIGPQFRFYKQTTRIPSMAVIYQVKIPTANEAKGLGSGLVDHAFTFLASKDFGKYHFDYNVSAFLVRPTAGGPFDRSMQMNLASSHPLGRGFTLTGEVYGNTELNPSQPAFTSTLWAVTYAIKKRFVVDTGVDVGLSRFAPEHHVFVGLTYSIADLYRRWRR